MLFDVYSKLIQIFKKSLIRSGTVGFQKKLQSQTKKNPILKIKYNNTDRSAPLTLYIIHGGVQWGSL